MNTKLRIKNEFSNTIQIEKSTFICYLRRCDDEESAKTFINEIRKKHYDATHVCTAYYIDDNYQKSNDDGEPKGTAGIPMLETIKKMNIEKICVCVVRYFGGIKLGAGGLIRAYSNSVSEAINKVEKLKLIPVNIYQINIPYNMVSKIEYFLNQNAIIMDRIYDLDVIFKFQSFDENIKNKLIEYTNGKVDILFLENKMIEISENFY